MEEKENLENLNDKPKQWGGVRPNSGRPLGSKNKATVERKTAEQEMKQRILKSVNKLINAQKTLAEGASYLFKIVSYKVGKETKKKHVLVTDPDEILAYLDSQEKDANEDDEEDEIDPSLYYYITTKTPDNKAIDSMLDRVFGKARQNIGLDGGDEDKPIPILATINHVSNNNSDEEGSSDAEENTSDTGGNVSEQNNLDRTSVDEPSTEGQNANFDEHSVGVSTSLEEGSDTRLQEDIAGTSILEELAVERNGQDLHI